ncbi:MAG: VOC family protein [Candidatus Eremiobacteraeota bacterium]|nr:VOC family protein [Candidatus Eremiobacteraeota bacterium]
MSDVGWTHVALYAHDIDAIVDFYARYARMSVVHSRRTADGGRVVTLSDRTRPFMLVLMQSRRKQIRNSLGPSAHLGVALPSRDIVDERCELARGEKRLRAGPTDSGPPAGYWALIADPDGHMLQISFGQDLGAAKDPT